MQRCDPAKMRHCLEIVELLKNSGIEFVPIPVVDAQHRLELQKQTEACFDRIIAKVDQ